jgi:hypothetical protein
MDDGRVDTSTPLRRRLGEEHAGIPPGERIHARLERANPLVFKFRDFLPDHAKRLRVVSRGTWRAGTPLTKVGHSP